MSASGVMEGVTLGLGSLEDKRDMVSSVQGGAIGVVKNLCKGSRASTPFFVLHEAPTVDAIDRSPTQRPTLLSSSCLP